MNILVTGAAGFIGYFVAQRLCEEGHTVVGLDNLNDYYAVSLKHSRLDNLKGEENFSFFHVDIVDASALGNLFQRFDFDYVIHLAAQAGVRYSIENPQSYINSNLVGFANILECCRNGNIKHLVYASSSSVYGRNKKVPFSVDDPVDEPVSLYAATKKSNELMAYSYSNLYGIPATGLRFFTVYGPWGRPDMAPFIFTKAILEGNEINVFNHGEMLRDFTYVDDIVEGVVKLKDVIPNEYKDSKNCVPHRVFNIGNNQPVQLSKFISTIEEITGKSAIQKMLPMQPGDVPATFADIKELKEAIGFSPSTPLFNGMKKFIDWYRSYYNI